MARALYARPNLYVFDYTLSRLDATTEDHVFRRVFRPNGPLRRYQATVVLFSPSVKHLASADHIVVLGAKGTVLDEGGFQPLSVDEKYFHSLLVNPTIAQAMGKEIEENSIERNVGSPPKAPEPTPELGDRARQIKDIAAFRHYFSLLGLHLLVPFLAFGMICGFLYDFFSIWLKFWSRCHRRSGHGMGELRLMGCLLDMAASPKLTSTVTARNTANR